MERLLDHFTKEEYENLHDRFGSDRNIAAHLFVDRKTLSNWKRENGIKVKRLSVAERVEIIKQMRSEGFTYKEIADFVQLKNANSLALWIRDKRKQGVAI